ncbi:hypothetical protein HOY80DRAFT_385494 [Tuber brumale]|nr:hypothetical protein HOY80DRAFT_385494 [Tuber brumale]
MDSVSFELPFFFFLFFSCIFSSPFRGLWSFATFRKQNVRTMRFAVSGCRPSPSWQRLSHTGTAVRVLGVYKVFGHLDIINSKCLGDQCPNIL